jgi:hypothetical protein
MEYLVCNIERMLSPEYLALPREIRAAHFELLCACAALELSCFAGARRWADSLVESVFVISRVELESLADNGLVKWQGDDLVVVDYDVETQRRLNAERSGGTTP